MEKPCRIFLIRHCEVQGNEEKRYNGHHDVGITEKGKEQYLRLDERLSSINFTSIYSSDLFRCRYGAELFGRSHQILPHFRRDLRELNVGVWEGMTWNEIQSRWPREWQARLDDIVDYRVPEGESTRDLHDRAIPAISEIVAKHSAEDVLVVAHGGINRVILLDALGAPLSSLFSLEQNYACLNIIEFHPDGKRVVKLINSCEYLP